MSEFKGTKGEWKEDIGIDLIGHNDDLMQIIVYSKQVNTHNIAHVFGLSQNEVMCNAKLISCAPEILYRHEEELILLEKILKQLDELEGHLFSDLEVLINDKKQLIKKATEL